MTWRSRVSVGEGGGDEAPPLPLAAVLDHYDVQYKAWRDGNQMVKCPVHEERSPSCSVNTSKGLWRCHSCGKAGDGYTLIQEKEDTDFAGALALATTLGLTEGDAGQRSDDVPGGDHRRRGTVSSRKGNQSGRGGYVPAWRRS